MSVVMVISIYAVLISRLSTDLSATAMLSSLDDAGRSLVEDTFASARTCSCRTVLRHMFSSATTVRDSGFGLPGSVVWGASVIRGDDGLFHSFASRWSEQLGHTAWVMSSEIVHGVSASPLGPFELRGVALPRRGASHWDGMATHNPTIHWDAARREYALFYIGITYDFAPPQPAHGPFTNRTQYELAWNNKRIGVASSASLDGPWRRRDVPILEPRPGEWDGGITSNPAPHIAPDGSVRARSPSRSRPRPRGRPVRRCPMPRTISTQHPRWRTD